MSFYDYDDPMMIHSMLQSVNSGGANAMGFGGGGNSQASSMSRQLGPMRMMRYLRPPNEHMGRYPNVGQRQNPFFNGQQQQEPDYSQFTYDPEANATARKALSPYGLSPLDPSQVNPNAFFPNSGFFGRHPGLTRGLEGAMFGAAATQGSNTWGEGISNVAQGMLGGRSVRQSIINRQFEAPFQAANMLESMDDHQQRRQLQEAQIQNYRSQEEDRKNRNALGYDKLEATRPLPVEGGWMMFDAQKGWNFQEGPESKARNGAFNAESEFWKQKQSEWNTTHPGQKPSSKVLGQWQKEWKRQSETEQRPQQQLWTTKEGKVFELRPGMTVPKDSTPIGESQQAGGLSPQQKESLKTIDAQMGKLDSKEAFEEIRSDLILQGRATDLYGDGLTKAVDAERGKRRAKLQQQRDAIMAGGPSMSSGSNSPKVRTYNASTRNLE